MDSVARPASFELLSPLECYGLLSSTTVGKVAFVGPRGLVLLPVNYRVVDGDVLLRTSATSALADLADHAGVVLFVVDYHAPSAQEGWSVLVRGTSAPAIEQVAALVSWVPGATDLLLSIHPHEITGRRVG